MRDEAQLFEMLTLESFQSGLSWITILRKQENFRAAFNGWDIERDRLIRDAADFDRLMADAGIVRNRAKIEAAIANARAVCALHSEGENLSDLLWGFAPAAILQRSPPRVPNSPRPRPSRRRWRRSSSAAASGSSGRRPPTP